ncbi:MAG: AbrB/MazE/SpoVT family DNA-binding domain-containing protein [Propionibacteriaceae bacterium]|jgi:AbrB family looped-hinge helix DNA binding protein|nr:AbrB/MazE/SpoVT family DNA-binding domain-containing protein [Propionibacteriaceae bacterium]
MSTKGQLTIPQAIRERHGLSQGVPVTVEEADDGSIVIRKAPKPAARLAGMFGLWPGAPVSLDEMDQAVAGGAAR